MADCQLPTAYCLLPTAHCLLPTAYCLLPTAYCLLPTAYCLLFFPSPRFSGIGSIGSLQSAGNGLIWSGNLRLEIRSPC